MYYPYFRGKQFELEVLREQAELLATNDIHPIIEPVKANLSRLRRTIEELVRHGVSFILVVNPKCGQLKQNNNPIVDLIDDSLWKDYAGLSLGYITDANTDENELAEYIAARHGHNFSIVHYGFTGGQNLARAVSSLQNIREHVFIEGYSAGPYRRFFRRRGIRSILVRDGFRVRKNEDYPESEYFSDLHTTYGEDGMDGFGDFLIVGDRYFEKGGPAYAIAIHLSYLGEDGNMYVYHFLSERSGSPTDPDGKFMEALNKLVEDLNSDRSLILRSAACDAYLDLFRRSYYPGLGHVKKLSMQHHIELMVDCLSRR